MPEKSIREESAQFIKGVGPARFKALNRLGIHSIYDLLYFFPRRYEDRSQFKKISELESGNTETIKGEIISCHLRRTRRQMSIVNIKLTDGTAIISAVWFNQPYLGEVFKGGEHIILHGKVDKFLDLQMNSPEFEMVSDEKTDSLNMGRIVPIYSLTAGLSQRIMRSIMYEGLSSYAHRLNEFIPYDIRSRNKLPNIVEAIRWMHFPDGFDKEELARKRFVFEEFFLLQLAIAMKRVRQKTIQAGISHNVSQRLCNDFIEKLPFELTESQTRVIREIEQDMARPQPMNRLLQGDVGSGKTVIAAYALLVSANNGFQAALLAPTEILAEQHFVNLSNFFLQFNLNVGLLISGISPRTKERIKEELKNGEIEVIIGTHALLEEDVLFKKLGLVVIDEQHKFGVMQRKELQGKGLNPDVLIMTATPIPRTLALTVYGDLDISTLYELPQGRGKVRTFWVSEDKREDVYTFIGHELSEGRQAFVVYPLIEESEVLEVRAATKMYEEIKTGPFSHFRVGLLHGRLSSQEKNQVMQDFKEKKIALLVSTVVIEVGIDIPNVTVMLVENAERFGLSQLHQLRGRIGRGKHPSYCILISGAQTEEARHRLTALVETQDGFKIAEEDLKIRGPGEFLGELQHGFPEIRIGDILQDMQILEGARLEAFDLIKQSADLAQPKHRFLLEALKERFANLNLLSVG